MTRFNIYTDNPSPHSRSSLGDCWDELRYECSDCRIDLCPGCNAYGHDCEW